MDPVRMLIVTLIVKAIPWLLFGTGLYLLYRSLLGRALAQRIRHGSVTTAEVASLAEELPQVRGELAEVHERLDFAERALTQQQNLMPRVRRADDRTPTPPDPVLAAR
jgi:outer membrane protein TolC